jgi:pimeloyl-ACP methyl ester carboxylesterase
VVLVHGGRFAASCWDRMTPLLDAPVVAVDLPGRGSRSSVDLGSVGIDECVEAVVEAAGDWQDIVVVGHSLAGVTLPSVAAALGDRVARLVFVSAAVPQHGQCVLDTIDAEVRASVTSMLEDGVYRPVGPAAASYICNDMDEELTRFTMERQVDETIRLLSEPVDLRGLQGVPCTYVRLTNDATLLPSTQDASIAALDHPEVVELGSGHMAMISQPEALARLVTDRRRRP